MKLTNPELITVDTRLIIDGDIPVFAATASAQQEFTFGEDEYVIHTNMNDAHMVFTSWVLQLAEVTGLETDRMVFCFSGDDNFRKGVYPQYKQNRKGMKPAGFGKMRRWVAECYDARSAPYLEGDDMCGLLAKPEDIIVSIDKDMLTVPGIHYNPDTMSVTTVSKQMAVYQHALQTLTGDTTDNYPGCPGVGPVRAARILDGLSPDQYWDTIVAAYEAKDKTREDALANARCAYILHAEDDYDFTLNTYRLWQPERWNNL